MTGLVPPSGIRLDGPAPADLGEPVDVVLDDISIDPSKNALEVQLPDGSVTINLGGVVKRDRESKFGDNLAEDLSEAELGAIADEILRGVQSDEESRTEWLATRTAAIEMLGFKLEKPGSGTAGEPAGISKVRHPVIAEAVIRGQATARSELLPTDGPVKVRNDDPNATLPSDTLANALQKDMNHWMTTTASEYYPDTDRMLFWIYLGGCGFKKVYHDPIRNRPVSESVDAENIIVSNAAIDIKSAPRVTHRFFMRKSTLKRMQILEAYRDIDIEDPAQAQKGPVDQAKESVAGVRTNQSNEPNDREYEMFEVYCELDIPGFEHKGKNGKPDGLAVPYRVTIEKNSQQILEIRRNWEEGDALCMPKVCIVKFPFLPSFGFYDIGLAQILGNLAMALTAGVREGLDAGMFANFPGGLVSKQGTRQNTIDMRVSPGQLFPVDTGGGPIKDAVMSLPYKEMGPGMMSLIQYLADTAQRLGGAANVQVGEGRQDAPVGTTIALIEQAVKPMDAVHKRLVHAQGEELKLLVNLFREDPEAFYRDRKLPSRKPWNEAEFIKALQDYDLVPAADPNTSSSIQRIAKAQAVYQLAKDNPNAFDQREVYQYVLGALGVTMADQLLNNQPAQQQPDLKGQAAMASAQAAMISAQAKKEQVEADIRNTSMEDENRDLDRQSEERKAAMKLAGDAIVHNAVPQTDALLKNQDLFHSALTN